MKTRSAHTGNNSNARTVGGDTVHVIDKSGTREEHPGHVF